MFRWWWGIGAVILMATLAYGGDMPKLYEHKELISLEENNRQAYVASSCDPRPNGVACPKCGAELYDSSPCFALTSHPLQYYVHCPSCKWHGTRN